MSSIPSGAGMSTGINVPCGIMLGYKLRQASIAVASWWCRCGFTERLHVKTYPRRMEGSFPWKACTFAIEFFSPVRIPSAQIRHVAESLL